MRIAIVGGGIGGLTLAAALHRAGLSARVYERDEADAVRPQGYALSLTESHGLQVLGELGLDDEIRAAGLPVTDFNFVRSNGASLMCLRAAPGTPRGTVGVSREILRACLLGATPADWVVWGAQCTGVSQTGTSCSLRFADGSSADADHVVVADGAGSRVRASLIGDAMNFLGLQAVGGIVRPDSDHPLLSGGAFMSLGRAISTFVQRYGENGEAVWSVCTRAKADAFDGWDGAALQEHASRTISGWHSPIPELVAETDPANIVARAYYDRDPLSSYVKGNVVLIGDAAHPMSPFQGQGGNMAMVDALELSRALKELVDGDSSALARFDQGAVKRNRAAVMRSRKAAQFFHSENGFVTSMRNGVLRLADKLMPTAPGRDRRGPRSRESNSGNK